MSAGDVVIVGAGPTGLMLACELTLMGVRPVVLDRLTEPSPTPKANGLMGQIVQSLDHRGLLDAFTAEGSFAGAMPGRLMVTSLHPGVLLVAVVEPNTGGEPGPVTIAEFQASVRRVLGTEPPLGEPIWLTSTVAQARLVEMYRRGHVLLAGDAAHLFPAGGSSLNVGLIDVINLGWKLAADIGGHAPAGLLDSYHTERHPVAARALMHTRIQALLDRSDDEDVTALRVLLTELLEFAGPLEHLGRTLQGSDVRYPMPGGGPHPLVGGLVPDLPLTNRDGVTRVAAEMRKGRPLLLDLADSADVLAAAQPWRDRVTVLSANCDDPPAPALLVRPDGYVAWTADTRADLPTAMSVWFGS